MLFNCSIRCGCPPSEWKLSSVIYPKKNLELNNQAILDLYHSCQLLAKFREPFLCFDCQPPYNKLSTFQLPMGIPATVSALIECTHDWFLHLDKYREIGAVFFDFKKAFDTVPHQPLLHKLLRLNLDPRITTWIHNYLADR